MKAMNLFALLFAGALAFVALPAKAIDGADYVTSDAETVWNPLTGLLGEPDPAKGTPLILACDTWARSDCIKLADSCETGCQKPVVENGFVTGYKEDPACVRRCSRQYSRCLTNAGC